jgi:predicted nuclease of predicted toxin-antitoxin system
MTLNIVIDMNLSPLWVAEFQEQGWSAVHWSAVGDPAATDRAIVAWAIANQCVLFTHDLDFTTLLALSGAAGPSVVQVRAQNVLPDHLGHTVLSALRRFETDLAHGAILTIDETRAVVRLLPIRRSRRTRT